MRENSTRKFWLLLFVLGAGLWMVHIDRPVDLPIWHEFDYASISRNFVREGNNILYPRIDWRGDGPGYTEMEFPIVPWTVAQLYRVFGIHEVIGRLLSWIFTMLALAVFSRLAIKLMPERAALIAAFFFVASALVTQVASALQPESLMLLLYLLAIYYFLEWYETGTWQAYGLATASFSGAMLVKSPSAHLGIFFLLWALHKDGAKAFRKISLYLFAGLAFAPVILWYWHAMGIWHEFHNSMGVANEDHWFGLDLVRRPKVLANLIGMDFLLVCGGGGAVIALAAIVVAKLRSTVNVFAGCWCLAVSIYLVVIMRTASAYWAAYYHVVLVAPVALLCGSALYRLRLRTPREWQRCAVAGLLAAVILSVSLRLLGHKNLSHLPGLLQQLGNGGAAFSVLAVLTSSSIAATVLCLWLSGRIHRVPESSQAGVSGWLQIVLTVACFTYFFVSGDLIAGLWQTFATRSDDYRAAQAIRHEIAQGQLIVASGGICTDPDGHNVASNAPDMFYWLDRKGFSTCQGHESIGQLEGFSQKGAAYFVADKVALSREPGFEERLRASFPLLADCKSVLLFRLPSS